MSEPTEKHVAFQDGCSDDSDEDCKSLEVLCDSVLCSAPWADYSR